MSPFSFLLGLLVSLAVAHSALGEMHYLDNGIVRIGVDDVRGGSITHLSHPVGNSDNLINNSDLGRQVQQSYYAGPNPYDPLGQQAAPWKPWAWNPIQSGDLHGNASHVVEITNNGEELYVKTVPLQWALEGVAAEATMETWITLDGTAARVRTRLTCARTDAFAIVWGGHDQEMPAVYVTSNLYRLVTYQGDKPYTSGPLTYREGNTGLPFPWFRYAATENWSAQVNAQGWGVGVHTPGTVQALGGFFGQPNSGGTEAGATGYIAPIERDILDANIVYEAQFDLILGSVDTIRAWVYEHRADPRPDFHFQRDRQHWTYGKGSDTGFAEITANGFLRVNLDLHDPQMLSPLTNFRAEDAPKLFVRARYHLTGGGPADGQLFWGELADESHSMRFEIIADGEWHTYELDLAKSPHYTGLIDRLRFDPVGAGGPGDTVDIAFITTAATP